jgi:hypothetical protein
MGAPGIEAGHPGFTVIYYVQPEATVTTRFQGFPVTMVYLALPQPPTHEPRLDHIYKSAPDNE